MEAAPLQTPMRVGAGLSTRHPSSCSSRGPVIQGCALLAPLGQGTEGGPGIVRGLVVRRGEMTERDGAREGIRKRIPPGDTERQKMAFVYAPYLRFL